jgi:hypothetical protein
MRIELALNMLCSRRVFLRNETFKGSKMKKTNFLLIFLLMSSLPIHYSWATDTDSTELTTPTTDFSAGLTEDDAGRGGGGGARPAPAPRPDPISRPDPVRPDPGPAPVRPDPVDPRPIAGPAPHPGPVGPAPVRPNPIDPGRPGDPGHPGDPGRPGQPGRIGNPYPIRGGQFPGPRWNHPPFIRPIFNDWNSRDLYF